jgi:activator of 2-hydroxyglutaryl-CoA dehydratase
MSTIVSTRVLEDPILFIGGLSMNDLQVRAFRSYFPNLVVPEHNTSVGALGVAIQALESCIENHINTEKLSLIGSEETLDLLCAPKLTIKETLFPGHNEIKKRVFGKKVPVYIGIDIGSTTTKYAVMNQEREIIHKSYVHTQGKPRAPVETW